MTREEVGHLLTFCAGFDQRTVGAADVLAWHTVLEDVAIPDARAAVVAWHKGSHERRISVGDVREQAVRFANARAERHARQTRALSEAAPDPVKRAAAIASMRDAFDVSRGVDLATQKRDHAAVPLLRAGGVRTAPPALVSRARRERPANP